MHSSVRQFGGSFFSYYRQLSPFKVFVCMYVCKTHTWRKSPGNLATGCRRFGAYNGTASLFFWLTSLLKFSKKRYKEVQKVIRFKMLNYKYLCTHIFRSNFVNSFELVGANQRRNTKVIRTGQKRKAHEFIIIAVTLVVSIIIYPADPFIS